MCQSDQEEGERESSLCEMDGQGESWCSEVRVVTDIEGFWDHLTVMPAELLNKLEV